MKRLLAGLMALAVLGVCAPSYGAANTGHYVLIYQGSIKAVKTIFDINDTNNLLSASIQGYWAMDINDSGAHKGRLIDSNAVIYDAQQKYYKVIPNSIYLDPCDPCRCEFLEFDMQNAGGGGGGFDVVGKGKLTKVYNEPNAALKKYVPNIMNGGGGFYEYDVFDTRYRIDGAATASLTLASKLTQSANSGGAGVDGVINYIVNQLTSTGGWTQWPYVP
ncbi:MAG: hypothetical protein ABSG82_03385 [Sedimentisphaerales bacterium]|jgi:hypothetical protein